MIRTAAVSLALFAFTACDEPTASPDPPGDAMPSDGSADDMNDIPNDMNGIDDGMDGIFDASPPLDAAPFDPNAAPIFGGRCPRPGRALARRIEHPDARLDGPDALAGPGDWLLASARAAFVITGEGPQRTYFYYPGIPVDAVRIDDCRQITPDRFEEIGWLVARSRLERFTHSTLRAFHGVEWQIVDDGADGGAARLRVTGFDDTQWLVENELLRAAWRAGDPRAPSVAQGVELFVDYVLEPDSTVLRMEYGIHNPTGAAIPLATMAMAQFGDTAPVTFFEDLRLDAMGFSVRRGLPWIASRGGDGAWAVAMQGRSTSTASISGVEALFDFNELAANPFVGAGQTLVTTWLLAVDTDLDALAATLGGANPDALPGDGQPVHGIGGRVVDGAGAPLAATVIVDLRSRADGWSPFTEAATDADGRFEARVPDTGGGARLRVALPGRAPVAVEVALGAAPTIEVGPQGALVHRVTDGADRLMPAHGELWQGDRRVARFAAGAAEGRQPVAPGEYRLVLSRGFEYARHVEDVTVPPDGEVRVEARLARVVDTTGWLVTDGHAHASPSSDSDVAIEDRVRFAAAQGIEVVIGTDHEVVSDWRPGVAAAGLEAHLAAVGGQEVTATSPEHTNAWPLTADAAAPRGDPVVWYGLDIAGVFDAIHDRGAPIAQLNHPRGGCNYMCLVDYDRVAGAPRLDDPTVLGLPADAALWSWDFEAVELMNGLGSPFLDPNSPASSGLFEDWQSFLNHGHRVTAMGVSDVHGLDQGNPVTYFAAPTDDPAGFEDAMLSDAILGGQAIVSAGAFVDARIDGVGPGGDVVPDGPAELRIRVQALPEIDVRQVVVYANCDQIAVFETGDAAGDVIKLDETLALELPADAHVAVAAFGRDPMPRGLRDYDPSATPRAMSNAIFVDLAGDGFDPPGGKACAYDIPAR